MTHKKVYRSNNNKTFCGKSDENALAYWNRVDCVKCLSKRKPREPKYQYVYVQATDWDYFNSTGAMTELLVSDSPMMALPYRKLKIKEVK